MEAWLFGNHTFRTCCEDARALPGRRPNRRARKGFCAERTAIVADDLNDLRREVARLKKQAERLLREQRRFNELDRLGLPPDFYDEDEETLDGSNYFYDDEPGDFRATDEGWEEFLKAHAELRGLLYGVRVNIFGDKLPTVWHYRDGGHGDLDRAELYDALARAFKRNGCRPVTHLQIGEVIWGPDARAVDSGRFGGVLYHAAKRGEVVRFADTKPVRFAPAGGDQVA
jgi:hypothetical protein